ncbi:MAG: hypothetical protein AAFV33_09815, partial [Chloroflexota bacterium]
MLFPLALPPGIVTPGTDYAGQGRWTDCNLVRWVDGVMQPVGGFQKYLLSDGTQSQMTLASDENPRSATTWTDNDLESYLAVGTNAGIQVMNRSGVWTDITPTPFNGGQSAASLNTGFGAGPFGFGTFGTPRTTYANPATNAAASWSFTEYGENLIGCLRGTNSLYEWAPGDPAMTVVANAPTAPTCCVTSPDARILMVGKARRVSWSDSEDNTTWTSTATNQAGFFDLTSGTPIVEMVSVRDEILILTRTEAWVARYVGLPLVFSFERVGDGCGVAAPNSVVVTKDFAAWVGEDNFFIYDGTTRSIRCDVL